MAAWATAHFTPALEVRIAGLSLEQERDLVAMPSPSGGTVIGTWVDETPFAGSRICFRRVGRAAFAEWRFGDGSTRTEELVESQEADVRRFDKRKPSRDGAHYCINPQGDLEIRDRDGLVATARRIRLSEAGH